MRYHAVIAAVVLFTLALGVRAEQLAYHERPGKAAYRYDITISGQMQPPRGVHLPMAMRMQAQLVDQVTGKAQKGLLPMSMTIKDMRITASSGEDEYSDVLDDSVLSFLRTPSGVMSKIRYTSKPQKSDVPVPGLENAWLLFSRFGHHLRLPEKALRRGEKWKSDETLGLETGSKVALATENTLVGDKAVNGKRYVHIESTFKLTAKKQPGKGQKSAIASDFQMTGKSSLLFDPKAGEVFRSTIKAEITTNTSGGGSAENAIKGSFTVTGTVQKAPPAPAVKKR
ncbi:MAG: hypothetical protein ACYDCO_16310 [Armatimonadota bacterium]